MKTVKEVSQLAGVSVRTLHYYDQIGLLQPSAVTEAGYRLYDDKALLRLQEILLFHELEIPLKHISGLLAASDLEKKDALREQFKILTLKRQHIDQLMTLTQSLIKGEEKMTFSVFNQEELATLQAEAKERWGQTEAYQAFAKSTSENDMTKINADMMSIFANFAPLMALEITHSKVQEQVKNLQSYISQHFYPCSNQVLAGLGHMYGSDNRFQETIDEHAGQGVSNFVSQAIVAYVKNM